MRPDSRVLERDNRRRYADIIFRHLYAGYIFCVCLKTKTITQQN